MLCFSCLVETIVLLKDLLTKSNKKTHYKMLKIQ
jgi:hypothetical protein